MPLKTLLATALLTALVPLLASAQDTDHGGHDMAALSDNPATAAYIDANAKMHTDMDIDYTGNPDADFVRGMIPHHQGAVDMARVVLEHGTDPEVKTFAEGVIAAQEAEIQWLKDWLAKNGQ